MLIVGNDGEHWLLTVSEKADFKIIKNYWSKNLNGRPISFIHSCTEGLKQ